jgi:hypothetical protein
MASIEPIDHVPVYRRIEIGQRRHEPPTIVEAIRPYITAEQQDRLWAITRQTAEGCNQPSIAAPSSSINSSEYVAPDEDVG